MINQKEDPVAWVKMLSELDKAQGHLGDLACRMQEAGALDEGEFAIYLGHIYGHLNRMWNSRHPGAPLYRK